MATELDRKADELRKQLADLATELKDKSDIGLDRIAQIETEISAKSAALDEIEIEKRHASVESKLSELDERMKAFTRQSAQSKASAILAGAGSHDTVKSVGRYSEVNFLSALIGRRRGDTDAQEFVKAVLGTSDATGQAIVPNNFVAALVDQIALVNPYRRLFNVTNGVTGAGVDIPYETDAITAALVQGAYGSNKEVRDFGFNQATATLYTIAQIADVGNQLLRQSNGAAESAARRRLAGSIGMREAQWVNNGSGSSQPLGLLQAFLNFGDVAAFKTALSGESRAAALGRGISALETRGVMADNLVIIMGPTDFWELAVETLGSSGSGGWVFDPATGAAGSPPITSVWGVPIVRDPNWPAAYAGTAVIVDKSAPEIFTGSEYRIDVSSEAGNRFDQNITGFRAEEEFAFNALPVIATGRAHKVTGL
jgi:HK97 family phage major capsid protein